MNTRLNVGQQWALAAKTANCILDCMRECIQGEEADPFLWCWSVQIWSGVLEYTGLLNIGDRDTLERGQSMDEEGMSISSEEEKA